MASFTEVYNQSVRPVLDAIDRVRPYLAGENIELPAIVVVGDQSCGKSSVLESISGVSLPRGTNIVTRCPLELQLRRDTQTYAIISRPANIGLFGGKTGETVTQRIERLEDVTAAIEKFTEEIAGTNKGVSSQAISLRVHRPDAPDLTLIDLPGITRVPVGDQPDDIYAKIKALILKYIQGDDKIILCIIPANGPDFSTAEGVLLARTVDPTQRRTLGVVTKIDRAEAGIRSRLLMEDAADLKLSMGFIAVRNRTQEEVAAREPLSRVRSKERAFFEAHPELGSLARTGSKLLGMESLERRLVQIQQESLAAALPRLKRKVAEQKLKAEKDMAACASAAGSESEAVLLFSEKVNAVQRAFSAAAEGDFRHVNAAFAGAATDALARLHVASRVYDNFLSFQTGLEKAMPDFLTDTQYKQMDEMTRQTRGMQLSNFLASPVFNRVYAESVAGRLGAPAEKLVREVREYVEHTLSALVAKHFAEFPKCQPLVKEAVGSLLDEAQDKATGLVQGLVEQQRHIFTLNPWYGNAITSFRAGVAIVRETPAQPAQASHSGLGGNPFGLQNFGLESFGLGGGASAAEKNAPPAWLARLPKDLLDVVDEQFLVKAARAGNSEEQAIREMQVSLKAYGKVVMRRVCDDVPLAVLEHLVMRVGDQMVNAVMRRAQGLTLMELMAEDPAAAARRSRLVQSVANLSAAMEELNKV